MLAKRLPVLLAFAGGCLVTALATLSRERQTAHASSDHEQPRASRTGASERTAVVTEPREPAVAVKAAEDAVETGDDTPEPSGHSVADVLGRLEASYRRGLDATGAKPTPPHAGSELAPAGPRAPQREDGAAPATTPAVTAFAAAAAPPLATQAKALAAPPPSIASPAREPRPAPTESPALARSSGAVTHVLADTGAPNVHVGDVSTSVHVGSVHQGDVYQVQQLALLQYMLALTPSVGPPATAHPPRRAASRRPQPFSTSLTDPNNPWGFDFPPTVLAK